MDDPQHWHEYRYLIWQKEEGANQTPHLQGFIVWNHSRTLSYCRDQNPRAHWEIARGTLEQNVKYCSKEEGQLDGPWTRGRKPGPGKRNDIHDVTALIDTGASMREVALSYPAPYVKYSRGFQSYRLETYPDRSGEPNIVILWGPTGCGKSKLVHATFPQAYRKPKGKWWDCYHTQDTVVLDDFYGWISYDELLRVLDWYPMLVEQKGTYVRLVANTFVFTTNRNPREWYGRNRGDLPPIDRSALWRRFKQFALVMEYQEHYEDGNRIGEWVVDTQFRDMDL